MRQLNPAGVPKPASRYCQAVMTQPGKMLSISGQVGMRVDGTIEQGVEAQIERASANLIEIVSDAGMTISDIVKVTAYLTSANDVAAYRRIRDKMLGGHETASTLVVVSALASPSFLFEVDGVAVSEGR